jgi:hypothetical protein
MLTARTQNWILLCLGIILLHPLAAWGQQQQDRTQTNVTVYESVSVGTLEGVLRRMNIQFARKSTTPNGWVPFELVLMTLNVALGLSADGSQLQVFSGFSDSRPELAVVNRWNREMSYTYAYTIDTGYRLASKLNLRGGVTLRTIELFIERFGVNLVQYRALLGTMPRS